VLRTPFTELLGIDHPVVSAGMAGGHTSVELVARVSEAGGLGVVGASFMQPQDLAAHVGHVRETTDKPIGINLLLHAAAGLLDDTLSLEPAVLSTAWPRDDQDLAEIFRKAHDRGVRVMHMVPRVEDAVQAAEAGADVIVAQGFEGGGHIGEIASIVIVRQVAKAVAPLPVLAAGGFVDGAGLAAALALGADGVLLGTRFLATDEAPCEDVYKQAIVASNGDDTIVTTVADTFTGRDWPRSLGTRQAHALHRAVARSRTGAPPTPRRRLRPARSRRSVGGGRRADVHRPVGRCDRLGPAGR
jgi:NAD(P)H-dependent flavin oxidoreductase YrpB (nitropropane dioxygenase family)